MKRHTLLAAIAAAPIAFLLSTTVLSKDRGYYTTDVARKTPSCGRCHRSSPGAPAGKSAVIVDLLPASRSLTAGQSIQVRAAVRGGQSASTKGGFAAEVSAGKFTAGPGTRVTTLANAIMHANPDSRAWSFGYVAPTQTGPVKMWMVGLTADGDGRKDADDYWAFSGDDQYATVGTPARLFVNAKGVRPFGRACVGSYGNVPVLGAATPPAVGNSSFALEVHGAAPATQVVAVLGANPVFKPIDLTPFGVTGCTLYVDPVETLAGTTGAGNARRGEGSARLPLPIPNDASLRGKQLETQVAIVDLASGRPIALTLTNALALVVQ